VPSPLGRLLLVCDASGRLRALDFEDHEPRMQRLLRVHCGADADRLDPRAAPTALAESLAAFFRGELRALDALEVRTGGSAFQRRVWGALREIPSGATTTYGALARAIGRPTAFRAVGLANGANPIAIVVPCHRVIGADGALTGYGGGLERKRWLLEHERRWRHAA
jgi:methylated-DNA-[protein]-cysteine S-methyltransferase